MNLDIIFCFEFWSFCLFFYFSRILFRIVLCLFFKIGLKDINDDFLICICNFVWINVVCRVDVFRNFCLFLCELS